MLRLSASRRTPACDGTSRRDFLTVGSLGLGATALTLADSLRARAETPSAAHAHKSVVWLWLGGGPTHIETFDPKPDAPAEFRTTTGTAKTRLPGVELGGTFPELAKRTNKLAVVRSFAHRNSGHGGGTHWVMTGYDFPAADNGAPANKPGVGAMLARHRGATNPVTGLPNYVRMGGILGDGASWLGPAYNPFEAGGSAQRNMALRTPLDRLSDRRGLLGHFDQLDRSVDQSGVMDALGGFERQAFDLILSRAKEVFDLNREDPRTRDRYGKRLGEQMLAARRLCEAGVGFVTIHFGGWDMHGDIARGMSQLGPQVDRAVSAFLDDLADRGLSDDVLLVVTGEFGRTPRVNPTAGRDHWAPLSTLALTGGGLNMGQVVGESSAKAEVPKSTPIGPGDLLATVFHVLGLPAELQYKDPTGRPTPMLPAGSRPIRELV